MLSRAKSGRQIPNLGIWREDSKADIFHQLDNYSCFPRRTAGIGMYHLFHDSDLFHANFLCSYTGVESLLQFVDIIRYKF